LRAVAPPAVPAPARAPAPAPQEPLATGKATGGHWIVNAASSADAAAALALVGRLQAAGLRARTLAVEIDGRRWHRVQVDAGSDREGALDLAQRIRRDFGLDSPWVSKADTPAAAGQRR
jgi:cell division septation protein DedD